MKKKLITLLAVSLIVTLLAFSASAAVFENYAADLNALGLFQGTGTGYDLDRAPTRAEAGVMLVRLLGQESAALTGDFAHPFTDVPEWADPYVGYLYENGLTRGVSDTEFGVSALCDAQMYTTFVLRAMGYSDADGDFTYAAALTFGAEIGIVDDFVAGTTFLRDNMVAISYLSLNAPVNSEDAGTLLNKLVADGAVTAEAAKPLLDRFALYGEYSQLAKTANTAKSMDADFDITMDASVIGQAVAVTFKGNVKAIVPSATQIDGLAMTGTMTAEGETMNLTAYYKDGFFYMNMDGEKVKMAMDFDEMFAMVEATDSTFIVSNNPSYLLKNLTKTTAGNLTTYSYEISADISSALFDQVLTASLAEMDEMAGLGATFSIDKSAISETYNSDKTLKSINLEISFSMTMQAEGAVIPVSFNLNMTMDVNSMNSNLTITYPTDLDTYVDMEEALNAAA